VAGRKFFLITKKHQAFDRDHLSIQVEGSMHSVACFLWTSFQKWLIGYTSVLCHPGTNKDTAAPPNVVPFHNCTLDFEVNNCCDHYVTYPTDRVFVGCC
jgi:hypothetical protein